MVFIDMKKTYDKVSINVFWKIFEAKRVSRLYVELIRSMYPNANTCVKTLIGKTKVVS